MVDRPYRWSDIEKYLDHVAEVDGGHSSARRGLVHFPEGTSVFVKIGVDETTTSWIRKEIASYLFLEKRDYPFIPKLLSFDESRTRFALEALLPENGWDWTESWSEPRLSQTLRAMDALANLRPSDEDLPLFQRSPHHNTLDGWERLAHSAELRGALLARLREAGQENLAAQLKFSALAEQSTHFLFRHDALIHNDVRADNCAWNSRTGGLKLIDWNWAHLGDRRIDTAAMLIHVHNAGYSLSPEHFSRLDPRALRWLAGFWFASAATPIWPGGQPGLRTKQLYAGITAYSLANKSNSVT